MNIEKRHGGELISIGKYSQLDAGIKQNILEKWDAVNDDGEVDELIELCERLANPLGFIKAGTVEECTPDGCVIGGVKFKGEIIAEKLNAAGMTVVGYTITCGRELHDYAESLANDVLMQNVAMDVCLGYLRMIGSEVNKYVRSEYFGGENISALNPGSLKTWPISGQAELFEYLGGGPEDCGIELTESYLMVPFKSGSGLYFKPDKPYENCMRCPRLDCENRRAPYTGE